MSYMIKSAIAASALVVSLAFAPGSLYAGPRDTATRACAARLLPATAFIQAKVTKKGDDGKEQVGTQVGSGFVVDGRGFIITNEHVIHDGEEFRLRLYNEEDWRPAKVVFADAATDLAVLQVEVDKKKPLPELLLGPSSDLAVGEPAIVIGSPFGDAFSLSAGVISKLQVSREPDDDNQSWTKIFMIQTDAAVNHGNSGGGLFNGNCETVGVVELKIGPAGIGLAITADRAARVLAQHMSAEWANVSHGITDLSLKVVAEEGPDRQQAFVKEISVGSPAAAVLLVGDRIVSVGGRAVHNRFDLERAFWDFNPGDKVKVHIERAGQPMDVELKLVKPESSEVKD